MIETKYRVWNKGHFASGQQMYPVLEIDFERRKVKIGDNWWLGFSIIQLMQHISLKSKSGVDIYEGDIVASYRPKHLGGGRRDLRVVERKQSRILNGWNVAKGEIYEVLGNIYENPELLDERS